MSLRSEILGWVIRQLNDIDAADPVARAGLFERLRNDVGANGFSGAAPQEALPHLESAIARQDVYWLSQQPPVLPAKTPAPARTKPVPPARPGWGWRRWLPVPKMPPGPAPGEAGGPFADHVYETLPLLVGNRSADCQLSWTYDPACTLTAHCAAIGFAFGTRAFSFRHAVEHLQAVLRRGGLVLPAAAFQPGAVWASEARDCETVHVGTQDSPLHAFSIAPRE